MFYQTFCQTWINDTLSPEVLRSKQLFCLSNFCIVGRMSGIFLKASVVDGVGKCYEELGSI